MGLSLRFTLVFRVALLSLQLLCASAGNAIFYESFDEPFDGRWIVSQKEGYNGVWKHEESEGHSDHGLLVSEKAQKFAIVKELDEPVNLKDGTIVFQYEVRLQNGLECGGAYLKYLRTQEAGWIANQFDNESPYSIMFGPDRCGATNKVHFILNHKNPKSGEYIEHHLKFPPSVPSDKLSHVYTAILKPDNEIRILIDGEEKKKANILSDKDFEPPIVPAKTIPDPYDKKPEEWDDRAKIPDTAASKLDDWDEDAPMEIEDEQPTKPEGWLADEPLLEIDDPEATKPEDWDDEEDGEFEAPKIDNETAPGCGEWKEPMKRNSAYKRKWRASLIDNPDYKGIWKPREIPNPIYFDLDKPNYEPIAAIGIEIWTMQDGILLDNVLITNDEKVAESYRATTWKPKFVVEKEKRKMNLLIQRIEFLIQKMTADEKMKFPIQLVKFLTQRNLIQLIQRMKAKYEDLTVAIAGLQKKVFDLLEIIEKGETPPPNLTNIGILISVNVIIYTILFKIIIFGGKKLKRALQELFMYIERVAQDDLRHAKHNVNFDSKTIRTLVTSSPIMVDRWISENNARGSHVIGLDVEWRPNDRFHPDNKVATLQLCVSSGCLIYQILHSPYVPESLMHLLKNSNCKFAGVEIKDDAEKLEQDYGLRVSSLVDLALSSGFAPRRIGLKRLARLLLGVDMDKPEAISRSDWANYDLTTQQVRYACIDAFMSYQIALILYDRGFISK